MLAIVLAALVSQAPAAGDAPAPAPEAAAPAPAPAVVSTSDAPVDGASAPTDPKPTDAKPTDAPARDKLLVLDVKSGDLRVDEVATLTQMIAARAHRFSQVEAVSSADLRELVTLEAEKQEAGCEGESCLAELAGALGARWVLSTRAGKIGSAHVLSVQLYDAQKGTVEARDTAEAFGMDELPAKVAPLVDGVLTQALGAPVEGAAPLPQAPPKDDGPSALHLGLQVGGGAGIAVGVVSAALGVVPYVIYQQKKGDLLALQKNYVGDPADLESAENLQLDVRNMRALYNNIGRVAVIGGLTLAVLGGGALAAGFLLPPLDELTGPAGTDEAAK